MPCVFPILAMKAVSLAKLSGAARGAVRGQAASYTAGVVLSFLALGGLLIGLRAAGAVAGWGFQFTSPVFVAAMAWLMLAAGLNLSGFYAVAGVGGRRGADSEARPCRLLLPGMLAVLVATPCTAPFMAAAIGAALALGPVQAWWVFAAWARHGAALCADRLLPACRGCCAPGAWMERRSRRCLPDVSRGAWLAWVQAEQEGLGVLAVLAGAVLIGFAGWAVGLAQSAAAALRPWPGRWRWPARWRCCPGCTRPPRRPWPPRPGMASRGPPRASPNCVRRAARSS